MRSLLVAATVGLVVVGTAVCVEPSAARATDQLVVTAVMAGLDHPWDVAFAPDGTMFVTERAGRIRVRVANGSTRQLAIDVGDLWASGETGLMGIEVDPDFTSNRRIYTCQGTQDAAFTVQVVAWRVDPGYTSATRTSDPLVGGIDGSSGRHGGCQLRIDRDGSLLVGTGDAAVGTNPQSTNTLAGKVLRVDRFTGAGVPGNPFFSAGGNASRIYTYGHRNLQGLALRPDTNEVWSVEHGSDRDDEINKLTPGGNYGWDPVPGYNESVPMTDLVKFPAAVRPQWSSGFPTIAPSAAAFLRGSGWGGREGALAVSVLKDRQLRILSFDAAGRFLGQEIPSELDQTYGRLRGAELGPGGVLFLTTDNGGSQDRVLAVAPDGEGFGVGVAAGPTPTLNTISRGFDDRLWLRSWTGSAWTRWASLGGIATSDPDASSWGGNRLDVVARGADRAIWHRYRESGGWSEWQSVGGSATSGPTIASPAPGRLDVFARGLDGALWTNSSTNDVWSGWSSLGGLVVSDADAVAVGPSRLDVVARGLDDALWVRRRLSGTWSPWQRIGGILTSGPSITASGGRVDVFARGRTGAVYHTSSAEGNVWAAWDLGAGLLATAPDASWRGAVLDVYQRGLDGALYQISWTGTAWTAPVRLG